jgi:hypothetical protein
VYPFESLVSAYSVGEGVERISGDAIDAAYSCVDQHSDENFGGFHDGKTPSLDRRDG